MKITRIVATSSQRLFARKAALSSGSSSACAERLKMPRPKRATGTQASQRSARFVLKPRMLCRRSIGPSSRLASWRAFRLPDGVFRAVVMKRKRNCRSDCRDDRLTDLRCTCRYTFQVAVVTKPAIASPERRACLARESCRVQIGMRWGILPPLSTRLLGTALRSGHLRCLPVRTH